MKTISKAEDKYGRKEKSGHSSAAAHNPITWYHLCFKVFDCCLTLPCPVLQVKKDNAENIPITYYSSQQLFVLRIYGGTCRHTYLDQESSKISVVFKFPTFSASGRFLQKIQKICSNIFLMNDFCSIDVLICAKWWPALSAVLIWQSLHITLDTGKLLDNYFPVKIHAVRW